MVEQLSCKRLCSELMKQCLLKRAAHALLLKLLHSCSTRGQSVKLPRVGAATDVGVNAGSANQMLAWQNYCLTGAAMLQLVRQKKCYASYQRSLQPARHEHSKWLEHVGGNWRKAPTGSCLHNPHPRRVFSSTYDRFDCACMTGNG